MQRSGIALFGLILLAGAAFAQTNNYPYILKTVAGRFPLGDGGAATSALLYYPSATIADPSGNLFILDVDNYRIRKITPDGKISTYATVGGTSWDMKMAADGTLYVAAAGAILRISPSGAQAIVAGTGILGYSGDGGPAVSAQVGDVFGLALDGAGNIYFSDVLTGHRIRQVTTDGKIRTIAGGASAGFNGDNQPASSALLNEPSGIAVDGAGNIYVADANNCRIRRFSVGGNITTVAGTGTLGVPFNGTATQTPMGWPVGLWLDAAGNLFTTDSAYMSVLKITPGGQLTRVAGNLNEFGSPGDGPATSVSLDNPYGVSTDRAGNLYITEFSHLVRRVSPDGSLTTIAGRLHFAGDGGPATAALLNQPNEVAWDASGNLVIADGVNYRIRKIIADGTIQTWGGVGIPDFPPSGGSIAGAKLPYIYSMASDAAGNLYLGTEGQVWKLTADGRTILVAGNGQEGVSGDGGPATAATLVVASGLAVDAGGNVYVADAVANRVRVIQANTGIIQAFAGTGTLGSGGDGGLATSAQLNIYKTGLIHQTPLAVDAKRNVYIGDQYNSRVRMVSPQGIITTVVGNGRLGIPADGASATGGPFSDAESLAVDQTGNLYIGSRTYNEIYVLTGGTIRRISGVYIGSLADGSPALGAVFRADGMKVDANGDVYVADAGNNIIRRLVLNSPTSLTATEGDQQTAQAGQVLPKALKVSLGGRAGIGVAGVAIQFTVTSGTATLSAATSQTDSTGVAGVGVTLGPTAGTVVITATVAGTGLSPVRFTATATPASPACTGAQPTVTSVNSASDFGGSSAFAPGSWLEIKGTNLAQTTRQWTGDDFSGTNAPNSLDGVTVKINGKSAFVAYVSPAQINVQAPDDSAIGGVPVVVTTSACASAAVTAQETAIAPGLLAPAIFSSGGRQYLVATLADGNYVGSANLIPGVAFRPAAPGETITAYGIGFGATAPAVGSGTVTGVANGIAGLAVSFGSTAATVTYAGLEPGVVGLYQFNITVPDVADGDYPISFQVGGAKTAQTVYLTVGRRSGP
jgi:uncharacterized protein (TIGR03437 family)